jgi:C4-type Zn-finger protein
VQMHKIISLLKNFFEVITKSFNICRTCDYRQGDI